MPQISLYIDGPTLKKIENAALRQRVSISKWVADQLTFADRTGLPGSL